MTNTFRVRLLIILFALPLFTVAQLTGRSDDSLRKISDTMNFPEPFGFSMSANTDLSPAKLTKSCFAWIAFVKDSLKTIRVQKDVSHKKITASNVPATADITFTIHIVIKGNSYSCSLQNYTYHTINGKALPVEKAAMIKDYKEPTNIEKVIIMRNYQLIFNSLIMHLEKSK